MMNNEMLKDIKIRNAYRKLASDIIVQAIKDKEKYEKFLATGKRAENRGLYVSEHDYYTAQRFLKSDWCEMLKSLAFGDV
jgi:hypothetical protein